MNDNLQPDNLPSTKDLMKDTDLQGKPIGQQLNQWALNLKAFDIPPDAEVFNHQAKATEKILPAVDDQEERRLRVPSADEIVKNLRMSGKYSDVYIAPPACTMTWPKGEPISEKAGLVTIVKIPKKQTSSHNA